MILKAENLSMKYDISLQESVFTEESLEILPGQLHCITGESGCGKSTLLNILVGFLKPTQGRVFWNDRDIYGQMSEKERRRNLSVKIGYMMQSASLLMNLTVEENILCVPSLLKRNRDAEALGELLENLNIESIRKKYPSVISGGEYRRVMLARTLYMKPELILADEPTSNLDAYSAGLVRRLLLDYSAQGNSVVVATHDGDFIEETIYCHKISQVKSIRQRTESLAESDVGFVSLAEKR